MILELNSIKTWLQSKIINYTIDRHIYVSEQIHLCRNIKSVHLLNFMFDLAHDFGFYKALNRIKCIFKSKSNQALKTMKTTKKINLNLLN